MELTRHRHVPSQRPFAGALGGLRFAAVFLLAATAAPFATAANAAAQSDRGFLLGTPRASLAVRLGYNQPRGGGGEGNLWEFTRQELTVDKGDFAGIHLGGDLGIRADERLDVVIGIGYSRAEADSEFRDWVGEDDLPITQKTAFRTVPITIGLKGYLWERGRSVGRFAWIPRRWNPYAGIAGGLVWYQFEQYGEFVDYTSQEIFPDHFRSSGHAPTLHLTGGFDVSLTARLTLAAEGRYSFANASLGPECRESGYEELECEGSDFSGFPDLDLSGYQATVGLAVRF